jgi:hypothetical protein
VSHAFLISREYGLMLSRALERLSRISEYNAKLTQRNHDLTDTLQNICSVYQLSPAHMRELEELILVRNLCLVLKGSTNLISPLLQ